MKAFLRSTYSIQRCGVATAALLALGLPSAALANAPPLSAVGLGEEVYAAVVEPHELEFETRFGRLLGGPTAGQDNARAEIGYALNDRLRIAAMAEFERDPGATNRASHLGIEAVYHLGHFAGIDVAAYGEYELSLNGSADSVETKLLLQRRAGKWDLRFNLIGEKPLAAREPLALSYALSADVPVARRVRLGATGFGELGNVTRLFPHAEHYLGPVVKYRLPIGDRDGDGDDDQGVVIETGYLFAAGTAVGQTSGQFRLNIELEL